MKRSPVQSLSDEDSGIGCDLSLSSDSSPILLSPANRDCKNLTTTPPTSKINRHSNITTRKSSLHSRRRSNNHKNQNLSISTSSNNSNNLTSSPITILSNGTQPPTKTSHIPIVSCIPQVGNIRVIV